MLVLAGNICRAGEILLVSAFNFSLIGTPTMRLPASSIRPIAVGSCAFVPVKVLASDDYVV
jgi:hypothetical protein